MTHRHNIIAIIAATVSVVAIGVPAQAAGTDQPRTAQANGAQRTARPSRRICVEYHLTGSRMRQRDCRTEREWIRTEGAVPTSEQ